MSCTELFAWTRDWAPWVVLFVKTKKTIKTIKSSQGSMGFAISAFLGLPWCDVLNSIFRGYVNESVTSKGHSHTVGLKLYTAPDPASQMSTQQMSETPIQPDLLIRLQVIFGS